MPKGASSLPWEFQTANKARSFLPLLLFYGPLWLAGMNDSPSALFYYSRLLATSCSFTVDWLLYRRLRQPLAAIFFASAWPTLTYMTRPFSNTIETAVLSIMTCLLLNNRPPWFSLGIIAATGCFVRITFPAFAAPIILCRLLALESLAASRSAVGKSIAGALLTTLLGMLVDGWYFDASPPLILAPLNNLLYNMNPDNLALHGLHPRYMHLINFCMLFGLALPLIRWPAETPALAGSATIALRRCLLVSAVFGVAVLSIIPHQEPRFLLPAAIGLFAATPMVYRKNRGSLFWVIWVVVQLIMVLVFGYWHQGGVVSCLKSLDGIMPAGYSVNCSIVALGSSSKYQDNCYWTARNPLENATFITRIHFWKLYTPPRFFLLNQLQKSGGNHNIEVVDETGSSEESIISRYLSEDAAGPFNRFYPDSVVNTWVRDLLLTPAWIAREFDQKNYLSEHVHRCGTLHLGLDDINLLSWDKLYLRLHAIKDSR